MADSEYKIQLGVDLKVNDIRDRIREYNANSNNAKVKLGVKLDTKGIGDQIRAINLKTPVKIDVKLDTKSAQKQINDIKRQIQQLGNIRINLGGVGGGGNGRQDIQTVRIARSIDDVTRAYRELLSLQSRIGSKQQSVAKLDTSKNQQEILELSNQVDKLYERYQRLHTLFNGQFSDVQVDRLSRGFEITAEKLRVIKSKALDAKDSLDKMSTGGKNANDANANASDVKSRTQAYRDLMGVLNELNSKRLQLNGLDASSPQSSEKIQRLRLQIEQLDNEYNNLLRSFSVQGIQFTADQWNQLETAMARVGRRIDVVQAGMSDKSAIQSQTKAYKELLSISKEIGSLETNIAKLKNKGGNASQIEVLENKLRTLQSTYQQLATTMDTPLTADQWGSIYTQIARTSEELAKLQAEFVDTREEAAKDITANFGNYDTGLLSLENRFNSLADKPQEVRIALDSLRTALESLKSADGTDEIIARNEKYQEVLKQVKTQLSSLELAEDGLNYQGRFAAEKEAAMRKLNSLYSEGSAAAKRYGAVVEQLRNELDSCGNIKGVQNVTKKINALGIEIKKTNIQTQTFGDRIKTQFSKYSSYFSIASVFMYASQALRDMFEQVKVVDTAMTELKKVTDETDESYNRFLKNAASKAKELGTTVDGLIESTADFARLGYGFEDSQELAEVANIYAVVGDEINGVEDATQSLVSTLAAFKDEMNGISNSDFAMSIVDKMNEVSNNFAISSGGIGEALQRSASSMAAANNTLDETIAMITAANEVAQNPEKVGNAMKTISMRIRGAKTELEEAGESTDGMAESTATLRKEIMALSGVDIMLNDNTFKSTYQIMDELADKWEDLSDIAQATIIELVAGKHQGNIFSSLMSNFETAREALDTSLNSSGSAMAEHAKWSESLEASLNKLKAAWQNLSQSLLKSDSLKGALDAIIALVDGLGRLIDTFGALPTFVTAFAAFKSFTGKGFFKVIEDEAAASGKKMTSIFGQTATAIKQTFSASFSFGTGFEAALADDVAALDRYKAALDRGVPAEEAFAQEMREASAEAQHFAQTMNTATMSASKFETFETTARKSQITKQAASFKNAKALIAEYNGGLQNCKLTQQAFIDAVGKSNIGFAKYLSGLNGAKGSLGGYIASLVGAKIATFALEAATLALNAALTMGISLIISGLVNVITSWTNRNKELAESVEEVTSKFKEQYNELRKLKNSYDTTKESSMISKYGKLSKGVDNLGRNISLTSEEYSEYQSIVNSIADQIPSLVSGYDEQGNALLSCKGNVEELVVAYEKLIHTQNQAILAQNNDDIERNWKNVVSNASGYDFWEKVGNSLSPGVLFGSDNLKVWDMKTYTARWLSRLTPSTSKKDIEKGLKREGRLPEVIQVLQNAGYDIDSYDGRDDVAELLQDILDDEPEKIKNILDSYYAQFDDAIAQYKTKATALLSEAFDVSSQISGLNYGNISKELQAIAYQVVNSLDFDFLEDLSEDGITIDEWVTEMLDQLNAISKSDNAKIEAAFDLQTQFNGGKINFGQYADEIERVGELIESLGLDEKVEKQLKINLGISDEGNNLEEYERLRNRLNQTLSNDGIENINAEFQSRYPIEQLVQRFNGINRFLFKDVRDEYNNMVGEYEDAVDELMGEIDTVSRSFLDGLSAEEVSVLIDIMPEIEATDYQETIEDIEAAINREMLIRGLTLDLNLEFETTGIDALNTALKESRSATGLTAESIDALKARYKDLDGYNVAALFEETANGIRINSTELAKLEEEYKNFNKQKADKTLKTLKKEYDKLTDEIANCTDDQEKLNDLYRERDAILGQINAVATLAAQYEGLTSAYNEWLSAQEAGQDRDMYESIISGREELADEMSRGWLDDAAVEYLELLTGKELSTAGIDAQIAAFKELDKTIGDSGYSIWDFFTEDEDGNSTSEGVFNFFDAVRSVTGETAAWIDENGAYHFDFEGFEYNGKTGDAAIAEIFGTSEELIQILLKAAEDAGFKINIEGDYTDLANMSDSINDLNERLKSIGATDYTFNINATDLDYVNEQIVEAQSALQYFENRDGKINLDDSDVRAAASIFATLIYRKSDLENPILMSIDVSAPTTKLEEVLGLAQQLKDAYANLEVQTAIGADTTEAQAEIDALLSQISSDGYANIVAGLKIDTSSVDSAIASINAISSEQIISLGLDTSKIDGYVADEKEATVTYNKDSTEVDEYDPPDFTRTVTFNVDSYAVDNYNPSNLTRTVTYKVKTEGGVSEVNGTANANGTAFANGTIGGRAFKQGDWGINGSGVALGGELGTEILVRDGRWYTIGDNGAEFFRYRKGDIIFNHKQAEELFANGRVTSGGGRGKALANGTAFAIGSNAFGARRNLISIVAPEGDDGSVESSSSSSSSSSSGSGSGSRSRSGGSGGTGGGRDWVSNALSGSSLGSNGSNNTDDFEETIDFVEIAIERIERAIDQLDQKANNIYKSWSKRNSALVEEIDKVGDEIELQNKAYTRYMEEANSVGLDETYAKQIREGSLNIEDFVGEGNEELVEKIKEYQEWYEKALDCQDAIEELKEKEAELYAQRLEHVAAQYEGILGVIEHEKSMLEEYIAQSEAQGWMVSAKYYDALANNERENIAELEKQKAEMLAEFEAAMDSKTIAEGSEGWYEMVASIDEVTLAIEESQTALLEYEQTIEQLSWEAFDLLQDKISAVSEEANFLIELLSNDKLFDDNGQLTDEGKATMGLHGQNYNTYMYQADQVAAEAERLKKQLEEDPYDTELEERYREMIALQQEYILAAEDEKEAIRDLVEEGIELELAALQEKIDKYNEAIESQKDLYDYQKKVKEQSEEIASLEKQRAAYLGDTSEEGKAKLQEIEVSLKKAKTDLEETEYDRYISDQQQLLDELFLEYEEILNTRLDNIDALITDMIAEINADASIISNTIHEAADLVGYTLSSSMTGIWDVDSTKTNDVIAAYGERFLSASTTTNNALSAINTNLQNMIIQLNSMANKKVESASTSSAANSSAVKSKNNNNNKNPTANKNENENKRQPTITSDTLLGVAAAIWVYGEDSGWGNNPFRENKLTDKLGALNAQRVQYYVNEHGASGGLYNFWIKKNKNLDKYKYNAFKLGARKIDTNQFAWTQEDKKQEFIVRPSDGAILTPIARGDSVLNAQASSNIWDMANSPAEFIKDNLNLGSTNVPNNSNICSSYVQNLDKVVFNLPNVHNYDEMLSAMQRDKNFERLLLSMTIDRLAGKSGLAKGKSIR